MAASDRPARWAPGSPADPPQRLTRLPSWLLATASVRASRLVAGHLKRPADRTDYAILASLDESGPASQAELARRLAIDRGDLVGLLNRLVENGMADRRSDPHDRRRNIVQLTDVGRRALDDLQATIEDAQAHVLSSLDADEQAQLTDLLRRVISTEADHPGPES